jgi:hypothetical protein
MFVTFVFQFLYAAVMLFKYIELDQVLDLASVYLKYQFNRRTSQVTESSKANSYSDYQEISCEQPVSLQMSNKDGIQSSEPSPYIHILHI